MKSKLFSLIVSVLAAMCLWVYVMTVVNPDVDLTIGNIPVTFSGAEVLREDHGLVITGDYQEFVSVHFYGKNADLKTLDQHKDCLAAMRQAGCKTTIGEVGKAPDFVEISFRFHPYMRRRLSLKRVSHMLDRPEPLF